MRHRHQAQPFRPGGGFTLVEVLISMTILVLVCGLVFGFFAQMMLLTGQDELAQEVHHGLLLSLNKIKRLTNLATNTVPQAGGYKTGNSTVVLRVPRVDNNELLMAGEFDFAVVHIGNSPLSPTGRGLLLRLYDNLADTNAFHVELLDPQALAFGCVYGTEAQMGGFTGILGVSNLNNVCNVQYGLLRMMETGIPIIGNRTPMTEQQLFGNLYWFQYLINYRPEFTLTRNLMTSINSSRTEVILDTGSINAALRNRRPMGLSGNAPPAF